MKFFKKIENFENVEKKKITFRVFWNVLKICTGTNMGTNMGYEYGVQTGVQTWEQTLGVQEVGLGWNNYHFPPCEFL